MHNPTLYDRIIQLEERLNRLEAALTPPFITPSPVVVLTRPPALDMSVSYTEALRRRYPIEALRTISEREQRDVFNMTYRAYAAAQRPVRSPRFATLTAGGTSA